MRFKLLRIIAYSLGIFLIAIAFTDEKAIQKESYISKEKISSEITFEQKLGGQVPLNSYFFDERSASVRLGDLFSNKPVILVFAYYKCPHLCKAVLNGLVKALQSLPLRLGKDFDVVTISMDPRDKPPLALSRRQSYLVKYKKDFNQLKSRSVWHFLTGKEAAIKRVADSVGFHFAYDSIEQQFAHASGIVVLTPTGKVSQYFLGVHYNSKQLEQALRAAHRKSVGLLAKEIMLLCFHYDPLHLGYSLFLIWILRFAGAFSVLFI